jgi:hypothetical protein
MDEETEPNLIIEETKSDLMDKEPALFYDYVTMERTGAKEKKYANVLADNYRMVTLSHDTPLREWNTTVFMMRKMARLEEELFELKEEHEELNQVVGILMKLVLPKQTKEWEEENKENIPPSKLWITE